MHVKRFKCEFVSSIQQISIKCHENKEGGGAQPPPNFRTMSIWPNGWMDQDATWYGDRSRDSWPRWHCVRWGPSSPPLKGYSLPLLGPCLLWPNGWMDEDATWNGCRPQPRPHCFTRGPSSPARKRGTATPSLRPMSIVAMVAHLSYCWVLVL